MDCWICKQKAAFRKEKLLIAREEAKQKATDEKITMAIWKEGCLYKTGPAGSEGANRVIEYISVNQ